MPLQQVERLTESQVAELHQLYTHEWWTKERSHDDVRVMVENSSLIVGFVNEDDRLVAFCRVLTDFVFRATIYDVIVAESLRGQGLGRRLMDAVSQHARLQNVSTFWLCCNPDKTAFYEKWGFKVFSEGQVWMIKAQREG
jgi:N-acetylglutamate synthase-like GNAT family acetyltransferase